MELNLKLVFYFLQITRQPLPFDKFIFCKVKDHGYRPTYKFILNHLSDGYFNIATFQTFRVRSDKRQTILCRIT